MYTVAAQYLIYSDQTPQRIWVEGGVDLADVDGEEERGEHCGGPGGNCIKIGLPGRLILSNSKGLLEVLFS